MITCNKCGSPVHIECELDYPYYCPECDENMYLGECSSPTVSDLEWMWGQLSDVPIDEEERIDENWFLFPNGTHREEIWHWFDERYPGGVAKLMYRGEEQP